MGGTGRPADLAVINRPTHAPFLPFPSHLHSLLLLAHTAAMVPRSLNSTSLPDADTPPPPPPPPIDPNDDAEEQLSAEAPDLAARLEALELAASERAADLSSSSRAGVILEEPAEPSSSKPWWSPPRYVTCQPAAACVGFNLGGFVLWFGGFDISSLLRFSLFGFFENACKQIELKLHGKILVPIDI